MAAINFFTLRAEQQAFATKEFSQQTVLTSAIVESEIQKVVEKVQNLAKSRAIIRLAELTHDKGADALTSPDVATWRNVFERASEALLYSENFYWQARYISFSNNGQEVARINRIGDTLISVNVEKLQQKGTSFYVEAAKSLVQGETYLSPVTVNIERGVRDADGTKMWRAVAPVYTETGEPSGLVVLNINYLLFVEYLSKLANFQHDTLFSSRRGEIAAFDAATNKLYIQTEADGPINDPVLNTINQSSVDTLVLDLGETITATHRFALPLVNAQEPMFIAVNERKSELFTKGTTSLARTLNFMALIAFVTTASAAALVTYMTRPISEMTQAIEASEDINAPLNLPIKRRDEFGRLAAAFSDLRNKLIGESSRSNALFFQSLEAIITLDTEGFIRSANPAALRLFDYSQNDLDGLHISTLLPECRIGQKSLNFNEALDERFRESEDVDRETHGLRRDGHKIPIDLLIADIRNGLDVYFSATIRNISERIEAAEQRDILMNSLQQSNEELDNFAYVASHDLKAPLRVISNTATWLNEDLEEFLDDDTRDSLDLMRNRINRMEKLLDDLLEHSRIGRKLEPDKSETVPGDLLLETVTALVDLPDGFSIETKGDFQSVHVALMPVKLILVNLVSNAIKHRSSEAGVITISVEDRGDHYAFAVADDGDGVDPEFHEKITEMFSTLRPRDQVEGSGMGLAIICKHLQVAGEQYHIVSEKGAGFAFHFTWRKPEPEEIYEEERKYA